MKLNTLQSLYIDGLRDLYSAETQMLKALPKMKKGVASEELKDALTQRVEQTHVHVARLEWICDVMGISPKGKHCHGIEGLIEESERLLDANADADVMDAGLISITQHAEHYAMAGYGTARTYATLLGHESQAATLQASLLDEREADQELTKLALTVNVDAMDRAEGDMYQNSPELMHVTVG